MPVFFIQSNQISRNTVTIQNPLLAHLSKSLRIREGEKLWVGDEQRVRHHIRVDRIDSRSLQASILESVQGPQPPSASVVLGQALLKGDRMSWVIQKATELGVVAIIPLLAARVIVHPPAGRIPTLQKRWQRIAVDAAQQSEQWAIPDVAPPMALSEWFHHCATAAFKCALVERGDRQRLGALPIDHTFQGSLMLTVGPEGGWTPEEIREIRDHHFHAVSLGDGILRSETAPLAALSILQHRLGNLG